MPIFVEKWDPQNAEVDEVMIELSAVLRKHKCCLAAKEGQTFLLIKFDTELTPRPIAEVSKIEQKYFAVSRTFKDPRVIG